MDFYKVKQQLINYDFLFSSATSKKIKKLV